MQCASTDQFSYAQVAVTKSQLKIDLLDDQDEPVLKPATPRKSRRRPPCSQVVIPAE